VESPWETSKPYYPTWPPLLAKTFRHDNQWSSNGPFPLIDPGRLGNLRPSNHSYMRTSQSAKSSPKFVTRLRCANSSASAWRFEQIPAPASGRVSTPPIRYCDQTFARRNRMLRQSGARHGDPIFRDEHMFVLWLELPVRSLPQESASRLESQEPVQGMGRRRNLGTNTDSRKRWLPSECTNSNPSFNPRVFGPSRLFRYLQVFGSSGTCCKLLISLTWPLWHGRGRRFDPDQAHQSIKTY